MTPLLDARGLALVGRLAPTDLEVAAGQVVALVGPNGSGKTSLLHALAGIGGAGKVRLRGRDPHAAPPALRPRLLTFLPAHRSVHWPIPVADLIRLGLPAGGEDGARRATADLALEPFALRRADSLSTGERSRCLIARALAPEPALLLLDEPTANLDLAWQLRLMDLLRRRCAAQGSSAVVAIHDLELAARYADRLIILCKGSVALDGAPDRIIGKELTSQVFGVTRVDGLWEYRD